MRGTGVELRLNKKAMRKQTEDYVRAVYAAHPELLPPEPPEEEIDPYPLKPDGVFLLPLTGIRKIAHDVGSRLGIPLRELRGEGRSNHLVRARWECFVRCRKEGFSLPQIGKYFRRDHTTILHGLRAMGYYK